MKGRTWVVLLGAVAVAFVSTGQGLSQSKEKAPTDKQGHDHAGHDHGQPSMEEVTKIMQDVGTPGKEHAALNPLVGEWTCEVKFWMAPGTDPDVSTGKMSRKWILGDRYLIEDYEGTAGGMPFQGQGINGYDRGQKKYFGMWMDSMSTGFHLQMGTADASGKRFTYTGDNFCPIKGGMKWTKSTLEISSNDKHVMKMYEKDPHGKEFQNFDMTCTRR